MVREEGKRDGSDRGEGGEVEDGRTGREGREWMVEGKGMDGRQRKEQEGIEAAASTS